MFRRIMIMLTALLLAAACAAAEEAAETDYASVTYLDLGERQQAYGKIKQTLEQYPNLQKVDMYGTPITARQAEELEQLYPGIEFGWTLKFGADNHLVRTDATAFSTLHLSGSKTHGTKEISSVLRYCKKLKALDFGHNGVDDLSWLAELKDLRVLIIAINRVTDITPLAGLTKLEYLEMFNNHITDISPLKGLTHLMDLNMGFNRVQDFSPLYEMKWLKRLWVYKAENRNGTGNGISQEIVDRLIRELPGCQINYTSMPSLGGWREHPHFEVIHEMFRIPGYLPFEDSYEDDGVDQPSAGDK